MARSGVAGVLLAVLVVTSGCTGVLSDPVSFSASKATVSDAALDATGYEHRRTDRMGVNRTFSAAGQEKKVEVTNWISEYDRQVGLPGVGEKRAAMFVTFASPKVEVLGKSFNPLAEYDDRRVAERFVDQLARVGNLREVETRNRTMLGTATEVTKFETNVRTAGGVEFDAYLHLTTVEHEGDVVVAVAVYPRLLSGQDEKVGRLLEGIQHGE
jgi:hypothetical protein